MSPEPVCYTVKVTHWPGGEVETLVLDVASDQRSREAAAYALRCAADQVEDERYVAQRAH